MQPLFTFSTSKGWKIKEALMITSKEDNLFKCYKVISDWLLNDWCPCAKELPRNEGVPNEDIIYFTSNENSANDIEFTNESHCDSMHYLMYDEDQFGNDQENEKYLTAKARNFNAKKYGKKVYLEVLQRTLYSLYHML